MRVGLRFFASVKDYFKTSEFTLEISAPISAKEIFLKLFDDPSMAKSFLPSTRFAINCEYVSPETLVKDGDEVAFIPPVSGG